MKHWITAALISIATLQVAGCASHQTSGIPTGHFCYRQASNFQDFQYFACAFELSQASPYYDDKKIDAVVDRFMESKANRCQVYHRETLVEPQHAQFDHAYRLVVVHMKCGKNLNPAGS
jgi:hypothetical protein